MQFYTIGSYCFSSSEMYQKIMENLQETSQLLTLKCNYSAGSAETLVREFLGQTSIEKPSHNTEHILSIFDPILKQYVFAFDLHLQDDDKGVKFDRQRTEIKVDKHSPQWMYGLDGRVFTYGWKFKIDKDFVGTSDFCHIHQIKLFGKGEIAGLPKLTYTLRKQKLEIIIRDIGKIASADIGLIKGQWIKVREIVTYGQQAKLNITLTRVKDNLKIIQYNGESLPISSEGSMIRPKWGMYRSLKNKDKLRDERILFTDHFISQGTNKQEI